MANNYRAEIDIKLGDKTYLMRPTFQALCEIENAIDKSVISLLTRYNERGILISELIAITRAGIKAGEGSVPPNLDRLVEEEGICNLLPVICKFLEEGLSI
jgi:hypothetical protein